MYFFKERQCLMQNDVIVHKAMRLSDIFNPASGQGGVPTSQSLGVTLQNNVWTLIMQTKTQRHWTELPTPMCVSCPCVFEFVCIFVTEAVICEAPTQMLSNFSEYSLTLGGKASRLKCQNNVLAYEMKVCVCVWVFFFGGGGCCTVVLPDTYSQSQ